MSKICPTDWKTQLKTFKQCGCSYGSHHVLIYPGAKRAVGIPEYDEIDVDIIKNNMRTVNMSREEYFDLLNKI